MPALRFDNRFIDELPGDSDRAPGVRQVEGALYSHVMPTPVAQPRLLAHAPEVARLLGLDEADMQRPEMAEVLGGNALVQGMQTYASNYGGHQFGHWAGQLGDGRAINLGEVLGADDRRWELQLKGAGMTPYSRGADGRAVLRSSIREFLCSEAMHHLGVPTTRALSLVTTGERVVRDMFYDGHPQAEPGAIVCRVAPSFLRFGHFELPASRGDTDLLRSLVDFAIRRDFPHLSGQGESLYGDWFGEVCERTAWMVAHWMRVGFVHGVMNTDNMSILGLTIDYGPYGWIDDFDPDWTPNTTDAQGRRYRFGHQPRVAHWNLACLASALSPLFDSAEPLNAGLARFQSVFESAERQMSADKLGLAGCEDGDLALMRDLYTLLKRGEVDMTLWFSGLASVDVRAPDLAPMEVAFYDTARRDAVAGELLDWLRRYTARLHEIGVDEETRRRRMQAANPRYVLRNYLAQQAIDAAERGDPGELHALMEVMRRPYEEQPGRETYAQRRPDWARHRPGCSRLSCSS